MAGSFNNDAFFEACADWREKVGFWSRPEEEVDLIGRCLTDAPRRGMKAAGYAGRPRFIATR